MLYFLIFFGLAAWLIYYLTQKGRKEADNYFRKAAEYNAKAIKKTKTKAKENNSYKVS
jgi:hypothetical protein